MAAPGTPASRTDQLGSPTLSRALLCRAHSKKLMIKWCRGFRARLYPVRLVPKLCTYSPHCGGGNSPRRTSVFSAWKPTAFSLVPTIVSISALLKAGAQVCTASRRSENRRHLPPEAAEPPERSPNCGVHADSRTRQDIRDATRRPPPPRRTHSRCRWRAGRGAQLTIVRASA